jgi:hypothetical protein
MVEDHHRLGKTGLAGLEINGVIISRIRTLLRQFFLKIV